MRSVSKCRGYASALRGLIHTGRIVLREGERQCDMLSAERVGRSPVGGLGNGMLSHQNSTIRDSFKF